MSPAPLAWLEYHDRQKTPATLEVRDWNTRQRVLRALKGLGVCWGAAVLAVLLPVLHWILVPSLLLAGPVFGLLRYNERATVVAAHGRCPACEAGLTFTIGQASRRRMPLRCEHCRRGITLVIMAGARPGQAVG